LFMSRLARDYALPQRANITSPTPIICGSLNDKEIERISRKRWFWTTLLCLGLSATACGTPAEPSPSNNRIEGTTQSAPLAPVLSMALSASPNSIPADGASSVVLTATLTDIGGRPITGNPVSFLGQSSSMLISPQTAITNCQGKVTTSVASTAVGTQAVFGTFRGIKLAKKSFTYTCPGSFKAAMAWPIWGAAAPTSVGGSKGTSIDVNADGFADILVPNADSNTFSVLLSNGNGSFGLAQPYSTYAAPDTLYSADFNRDGIPDLVAGFTAAGGVQVFLGNVAGTLTVGGTYPVGGNNTSAMAVADFNQDGNADLVVATASNANLSLLYGDGNGGFAPFVNVPVDNYPFQMTVADFNADGFPDLGVACFSSFKLQTLLSKKNGFAAPVTFSTINHTAGMVSGDVNQDGVADLVVEGNGQLYTYLGIGNGSFQAALTKATPTDGAFASGGFLLAAADINRDGKQDILLQSPSGLYTYLASGSGNYTAAAVNPLYGTGAAYFQPILGDFNGDGLVDVATPTARYNIGIFLSNGNGTFTPTVNNSAPSGPNGVALADINKDGKLDSIYAGSNNNKLGVSLGQGNGTFLPANSNYPVGSGPRALAVADFNNDGNLDVAVANTSGSTVSVLFGTGSGTLQAATSYSAPSTPTGMAQGDFDKDGNIDLATTSYVSNKVNILRNVGGSFTTTVFPGGTAPNGIAVGDFNGDGNLDLALANEGAGNVSILLGNGNCSFGAATNFSTPSTTHNVVVADFNADGNLDLAATGGSGVFVLYGNGNGGLGAPVTYSTTGNPYYLLAAQINADSLPDLIVTTSANLTYVWLNTGSSFSAPRTYSTGAFPYGLAAADLDGDGRMDLVESNLSSDNFSVLFNTGCL
jgi:hypothetical protein